MEIEGLFPEATNIDLARTKALLLKYRKRKKDLEAHSDEAQIEALKTLERAVNLIMDYEVREIMIFRYIQGNSRQATVVKYSLITDRTVDRKLSEGIESVANTLKLWGAIK